MKIAAVIVNYRTAAITLDSLASLLVDLEGLDARVIIVDNDSGDGSFEAIHERISVRGWGSRVQVVRAERNGGFGYGNNVGIRLAMAAKEPPDLVLLINPDAYPDPGTCKALVDFMAENRSAGIVGTAIRGEEGIRRRSAFRFPSILSEFEGTARLGVVTRLLSPWIVAPPIPTSTKETDWISGACMMVRRAVFESIGLFDEAYFLYFEETDLAHRALRAGWKTYWLADACIVHAFGAATGIQNNKRRRPEYWFHSRRRYFVKQHGHVYLFAANLAWLLGQVVWSTRRGLGRQPNTDPPELVRDFLRNSFL